MFRTDSDTPLASSIFAASAKNKPSVAPNDLIRDFFENKAAHSNCMYYQRITTPSGLILDIAETREIERFKPPVGASDAEIVRAMVDHALEQRRLTKELQGITGFNYDSEKTFYCALWTITRQLGDDQRLNTLFHGPQDTFQTQICLQECRLFAEHTTSAPNARSTTEMLDKLEKLFATFKPSGVTYPKPMPKVA